MSATNKLQAITETSCLVNVMHEILVDRWIKRIPSIAVCPTQRLEKHVGFDVALPEFDKVLALQFKAYKRYKYKALDYFAIYQQQHNTLLKYPLNCAFYVFPDYKTHLQMYQDRLLELLARKPFTILNNTWFVEAHSIPSNSKKVYRNDLVNKVIPHIRWRKLSNYTHVCTAGFRIVKIKDHYVLMDPKENEVEVVRIPSGKFSFFYTKLTPVKSPKKQQHGIVFT